VLFYLDPLPVFSINGVYDSSIICDFFFMGLNHVTVSFVGNNSIFSFILIQK
jgi:hypothetical protein